MWVWKVDSKNKRREPVSAGVEAGELCHVGFNERNTHDERESVAHLNNDKLRCVWESDQQRMKYSQCLEDNFEGGRPAKTVNVVLVV